jgi:2-methylisocitrate lyase-like PEP mutase family enzyme
MSYARAGVAGLHIEDQVQEKRCGHLAGKLLVSREVFGNRLRAACKARDESGTDIVIIARTDARAGRDVEGNGGFDEAVHRLKMAAEIGVDGLFFEALQGPEECEKAIAELPNLPVLLNMVPGGKTPIISNAEANKLGFRIVIWPTVGLEAVVPALENTYKKLKTEDIVYQSEAMGPGKLFEVCGLEDLMAFDESVGGSAYGGQ